MTPPSTFSSAPPRLSIGFVLPPPAIGAGGYRKILRICYDLEQAGHHVVLYVLGGLTPAVVADVIRRNYYPITSRVFRYNGTVAHHQFLVATSWETAYVVRKHAGTADHCVYFVQDFEPLFNPIGSAYLKALATYMFGFQTICLGHWVGDRLKRELNLSPRIIPFPLDHATYNCAMPATARGKSILLYARPSQERRAFALATEALERVACRAPEVSIGLYGESDYPEQRFAFQNHGLFTDEVQLAKLYRNTTVGVCLSPTNPSLVGYEMMACGTSLVDLDIPGVEANYGGRDAVFLAMPTADDLAGQMLLALHDDRLREGRIERGLRLTSGMQSDESMAVAFQKYLLEFAQLDHVVIPDTGGNGADTPTLAASPARTSAGRGGRKHRATRAAAIATKTDPILVPST